MKGKGGEGELQKGREREREREPLFGSRFLAPKVLQNGFDTAPGRAPGVVAQLLRRFGRFLLRMWHFFDFFN
jgi:hypothetical protein